MGHPGSNRPRRTFQQLYYHPQLCRTINNLKCEYCQRYKLSGKGYGLFLEHEMQIAPWTEVAVYLIGPWKIKVKEE